MFADQSTLLGLCVALGIGLLVGAERERRKDTSPARSAAGIRTFAVSALLGAVSVLLGGRLVLAVAALMVGVLAVVAYQRTRDEDPGMTTEFALLLTCLLGGLAIRALGYVAMRSLGPRYGLPLAGFASGFVSSTATIYSMGGRASRQETLMSGAVAGAVLSSIATIIQLTVVVALIQPALMTALALPLSFCGLAACLYGLLFVVRRGPANGEGRDEDVGRAFDLKTAAAFAALVSLVLLLSAGLNVWLGTRGMLLGAAVTGLVDAHATAASVASLMAANKISIDQAVGPILMGLTTNTVMKAVVAFNSGGPRYAARIVPGLALVITAIWLGARLG